MKHAESFRAGYIAIVGRANVGKSTLLNRLVGQKLSITSRKPQTTRHRICGVRTLPAGQCVFVDTPGFQRHNRNALGASMNRTVRRSLSEVDVIVFVIAAARYTDEDAAVAAILPNDRPVIVAINKIDQLKDRSSLLPLIERMRSSVPAAAYVPVSAQRGTQLDLLLDEILALLPEQHALFPDDQLTDRDERFFAAEFVREKLFRQLGDEVPYGLTVVVDRFEQVGELRRISASVFVDKASHRAIVLGEGGARIKAVGTSARKDLEALFGGKVFLQLWVKVRTGWTADAGELKRLGYA